MNSSVFKFLAFLLLLSGPVSAQILVPTHLSTALSQPQAKVGEELDLIINARIDDKWHLYASDFSEDVGPVTFTLKFTPNPAYALVGKLKSINSHHEHDDVFNGEVAFWEKTAQLRQRIKVLQPGSLSIKAEADYQTCTDVDGRCVPGNEMVTFGPFAVGGSATPAKATGAVPAPAAPTVAATTTIPAVAAPATIPPPAATTPIPADTSAPVVAAAPGTAATPITSASPKAPQAVVVAPVAAPAGSESSLWVFALLAFLSGLVALLTPCVFPMIPMTVSFFMGGNDSRARGIFKAVVYGLSIMVIYTIIGVAVARLLGEEGPNIMATHWVPNTIFFCVFVAFGLSFLGLFEITLPHKLVSKTDAQADKGGWMGIFFMAFTLVLVSFSCTGPIVATVLSLASRGQTLAPVVGMLGYSLAFALPFTLFAIFPSWLKNLPRSGGWLNTVKVVLGFVELILALKFLSMVDLAYNLKVLTRDVYIGLWIVLTALLGMYLLGKFRLSHDSPLEHLSVGRLLMAIFTFTFTVYLIPGLFGAPLPLLAGYLPPQSRHDFSLAAQAAPAPAAVATAPSDREPPRFGDFLELPHNINGYFDLEQAKRVARKEHKPVFIDFTGHACVNCRKMEATVWSDPQVLARLQRDYVVVALYVDDKTELPEKDWYVSPRDKQQKTSLGKQNADLQVSRYGFNAQPYYVLLDPNDPTGQPLTPPVAYEPDVAQFSQFLQSGLTQFKQKQGVAAQ